MYNMQTSMRLGGGRVDERKDYGRNAANYSKWNDRTANCFYWLFKRYLLCYIFFRPQNSIRKMGRQSKKCKRRICLWGQNNVNIRNYGQRSNCAMRLVEQKITVRGFIFRRYNPIYSNRLTRNEVIA